MNRDGDPMTTRCQLSTPGTSVKVLAVALAALLLAACTTPADTGSAASVGSLGTRSPVGTVGVCGKDVHGYQYTLGWETMRNSASTPVTLTSVVLTKTHNLILRSARIALIPAGPDLLVGTRHGFDPDASTSRKLQREMDTSVPAIGATVPPYNPHHDEVNLVLMLQVAAPTGGYSGPPRVTYADADGDVHAWVGGSSLSFRPNHACT